MTLDDFPYIEPHRDLQWFIASNHRTQWIDDSGLRYYVRKSLLFPGLIELANCTATNDSGLNYYRFYKRHAATIPFIAENVINEGLAKFYIMRGWHINGSDLLPSFMSPRAVVLFGHTDRYKDLGYAPL